MNKFLTFSLSFSLLVFPVISQAADFYDEDDFPSWADDAIEKVSDDKIMTGFGDRTFRPKQALNRAEAVVLLFRIKGIDLNEVTVNGSSKFSDVPKGEWFEKAVIEATNLGWISGFPDGTFRPAQELNRAELATLITRVFELEGFENPEFKDVPTKSWFSPSVFALYENGLIRQENSLYFRPEKVVSRADIAWIIAKISSMPRLMGTSEENDFSDNLRLSSRRVAIKPRDFNPNKQGYDSIKKKELAVSTTISSNDPIEVGLDYDWVYIGDVTIANSFEENADVDLLELRLRFEERNVGPTSTFMAKIKKGETWEKELPVGSTGQISFVGVSTVISGNESVTFQVFLKPNPNNSYFLNNGIGELSVFSVEGLIHAEYKNEDARNTVNLKKPPVSYESRELSKIKFIPVEEIEPEVAQAELDKIRIDGFVLGKYANNEKERKVARNFAAKLEEIITVADLALLNTDNYLKSLDCMTANYLGHQDVLDIENEVFNDEAKKAKYVAFKAFYTNIIKADRNIDYANLSCNFE